MSQIHKVDLCIVGGGMAGVCAAVAAARHGIKVALMQDRPVLGGNASSEIRMWICGAHGENNRETGILEEIQLENLYRNHELSYTVWDSVVYEKVMEEENITLILNCSCTDAEMDGDCIKSIKGWQTTTYEWHTVEAKFFADCSGDSVLAPLTGAEFRVGREARSEFNEPIAPITSDKKTMGMSCLFQVREMVEKQKFIPPKWAYKFEKEDLPFKDISLNTNFWWIELGGEDDSIKDTEKLRHELLKITFGVWDHMKNRGDYGVDNWALDWVGFLPGKRESRRYIGDHVLCQSDVESEGRFDDLVAYGGWSMDDHFPAGFRHMESYPTIFHPAPSPYGIPYRCMYSKNITNLFMAGRNISATHAALSSTRVMATCTLIGQAVGTAASIAVKNDTTPRGVYEKHISLLKNTLMNDDCYLPFNTRLVSELSKNSKLTATKGDPELLRSGNDRDGGWCAEIGESAEYRFDIEQKVTEIRVVFDSDLDRNSHNMPCNYPLVNTEYSLPATIVKEFKVLAETAKGEQLLVHETNNYQRFYKISTDINARAIKLVPLATTGNKCAKIITFEVS